MYTNGMNSNEIGKIIGVSGTTILRTLEKNGIKRRELSTALRTYPCNEHYFDVIDTEDKSYFFGLLFADGSLHNSLDTINISLQEGDKDILELMTTYIQPTKKLYYLDRSKDKDSINRKNQYKMEINSIHMGNLLNSYGLIPNKSLIKQFPKVILNSNEDIIKHFIRGYYDGNGGINVKLEENKNLRRTTIFISSTYQMCDQIRMLFLTYCNVNGFIDKNHTYNEVNNYILSVGKIYHVKLILDWMYSNSTIYLTRKYDKYLLLREKLEEKHAKGEQYRDITNKLRRERENKIYYP